jgi:DNA-binding transcriptional LysR family regulator
MRAVVGLLIDTLKPMLYAGEIDLMVGSKSQDEAGFASQRLAEDNIVVAAKAGHDVFRSTPSLRGLTAYRRVLQPLGRLRQTRSDRHRPATNKRSFDELRSRQGWRCSSPLLRPSFQFTRRAAHQMRTRSAGLRHIASPGRVPKALWKASRFISGA